MDNIICKGDGFETANGKHKGTVRNSPHGYYSTCTCEPWWSAFYSTSQYQAYEDWRNHANS